jgi:acyl-CoA synthetase (AMP-forming)/AMP-acid ligase II
MLMPNGPDWVLAWLAAARIGALVIPLSTFSQARELHWLLRHADVDTLFATDRYLRHDYLARLEQIAPGLRGQQGDPIYVPELPYLRSVRVWGDEGRSWTRAEPASLHQAADAAGMLDDAYLEAIEENVSPADLAVVLYTSGSTAEPKGACHTHGTLVRHSRLVAEFLGGGQDDRQYSPPPFFWVGGFQRLLYTMQIGAAMAFLDSFDPDSALQLIKRERASILMLFPHQAKALLDHPQYRPEDFEFLRSGPFEMLPEQRRPEAPDLIANAIGMTESFAHHTIEAAGAFLPEAKRGACGRPLPGMERQIHHLETGEPLAPGAQGELWIRGFNLMQGLYKREREEVFTSDGFYQTGDRGLIDADDYYFFDGRLGDMIKTGGANVSPREVEIVLANMEGVEQAHVAGVSDPEMGQIVVAGVVPSSPSAPPDLDKLREQLRLELSAFKVPRHLLMLAPEELPFTDSGKLHPGRLRDLLSARVARS